MSTLTDPTSTPPGERIDTGPLAHDLDVKRLSAYFAAEVLIETLERGDDIDGAMRHLHKEVAAARTARDVWTAAVEHNLARRLTAQQHIAEARQELAAGVARSNGYRTRAEADEARAEDRYYQDLDALGGGCGR